MRLAFSVISAVGLAVVSLAADDKARITGEYVEARTAEVFAGGCIMNSEAETAGLTLPVQVLLLEGLRRLDEESHFRSPVEA